VSGNILPIGFGHFGKFNTKGTNQILYQLAKAGAITEDGLLLLSPHPDAPHNIKASNDDNALNPD
jgi:hypothetical protein